MMMPPKSYMRFAVAALVAFPVLAGAGCGKRENEPTISYYAFTSKQHRFSFDYPKGWGPQVDREGYVKREPNDPALVKIFDKEKRATISVTPFRRMLDLGELSGQEGRLQAALAALEQEGPTTYEDFNLLRRGTSIFADKPNGVGELVFESGPLGEGRRWNRVVVLVPKDDSTTILLVHLTAPLYSVGSYVNDFDTIERTWKWSSDRSDDSRS